MTTVYPAQIDTPTSLPIASTNTPLDPNVFNALRGAIINIEQTLGVNPAATFGTIGGALIILQNLIQTGTSGVQIGGDIGGTNGAPVIIGIQGFPISNAAPVNGQILGFIGGAWAPINSNVNGPASGDLGGNYPNPSVIKVNGVLYGSNPSTNTVPVVTSTNTVTYQQIVDAQISSSAAISGTKINPNFGGQTVSAATIQATGLSTGIVHANGGGTFSSSTIVNADVSAAAAIAVSKLAAGTSAQILLNNSTPSPTWTTISGDIIFSSVGVATVEKIQGVVISGTPQDGYALVATTPTAASWQTIGGTVILAGDVTGAGNANTVTKLQGTSISTATPSVGQVYALGNDGKIDPTTIGGDVTGAPASLQVVGIDGYNLGSTVFAKITNVRTFGALGNGSSDDTASIQAALNVIKPGDTLYFPRGNYIISSPLILPTLSQTSGIGGFTLAGDGATGASAAYESAGSCIVAQFPTIAGTDGYMASISQDPGGSSTIVTLTSVAGFGNTAQGDQITISNAAVAHNNGVYTIITVSAHSLTYFSFNYDVPFFPLNPTLPDANNHSIHWQIGKPMVKAYTRDTTFKNMVFNGNNTNGSFLGVGCCIDTTFSGANNVTVGNNTNMQFENCYFLQAVDGIKVGDFSGYITGATGLSPTILPPSWYPGNCDLYRFVKCTFDFMTNAGIHIPNTTGQSKVHQIEQCTFEFSNYGLKIASGSFNMVNSSSEANLVCDIALLTTFDTCAMNYYSSENAPRLIEVAAGTGANETVSMNNVRADTQSSFLAADGYFIRFNSSGIYSLSNSNFFNSDNNRWSIGLGTFNNIPFQLDLVITNCNLPSVTPKNAVTDLTGAGNVWYSSFASICNQGTTSIPVAIPNGIQRANSATPNLTTFPSYQIPNLTTPNANLIISSGTINNLPNPRSSSVLCTGPTGSVTLTGITAGEDGQNLELIFGFNQTVQINHDSGSSSSGNKIFCGNSSNVILNAPSSGGFSSAKLRYSTLLDSGNGGWYLLSNNLSLNGDVTGTAVANTVTKIQGTSVSATIPTNQQALVFNGSTYIAAGIMSVTNVRSYGATGNGSTDDSAAINAAIAAAAISGHNIYFPAGNYLVNSMITFAALSGVIISGDGTFQTFITGQNSNHTWPAIVRLQNCFNVQVRDMFIQGNNGTGTQTQLTQAQNVGDIVLHVAATTGMHDGYGITVLGTSTLNGAVISGQRYNLVSHTSNTITIDPPLMYAARVTDSVSFCANSCIQLWNDAFQPGESSNDCLTNVYLGTTGNGPAAYYGIDISCADGYGIWPGIGGPSDGNNDIHMFTNVMTLNVSTGARVGHLNSLTNNFNNCYIVGQHHVGIESIAGNYQINGGNVSGSLSSVVLADYSAIGQYTHPLYVNNTDGEEQNPLLISPRYVTTITQNITDGYDGYWGTLASPRYYKIIPVSTTAFFWGSPQFVSSGVGLAYAQPIVINQGSPSLSTGEQMFVAQVDHVNNLLYCITYSDYGGHKALQNSYTAGTVITATVFEFMFHGNNIGNAYPTSTLIAGVGSTSSNPIRKIDVLGSGNSNITLTNCSWGTDPGIWISLRFLESAQLEIFGSGNGSGSITLIGNRADWNTFEIVNKNWIEYGTTYADAPNQSVTPVYNADAGSFVTRWGCFNANNKFGAFGGGLAGGLQGVSGISGQNQLPMQNFGGQVTISGASTTAAVDFPIFGEIDGYYKVMLSFDSLVGTPASTKLFATNKTTANFTVNVDVAPGGSNACIINWLLFR
jgi:hypothetical protein